VLHCLSSSLLSNGHRSSSTGSLPSEQERNGQEQRDEREEDEETVSDVNDVVVSAPDRVVDSVVLIVAGDGRAVVVSVVVAVVSIVEYGGSVAEYSGSVVVSVVVSESVSVVEEGHALTSEDSSENDVDNAQSNQSQGEEREKSSMSSSPSEETDKSKSNTEVTDEDRNNTSQPSGGSTDQDAEADDFQQSLSLAGSVLVGLVLSS